MNQQMRKLITITAVIVGVIGLGYFGFQAYINSKRGTVIFESVPTDLKLTLNGKGISANGKRTITPGTYTLEGRRSGFETRKAELVVERGKTQNYFFYLTANGPEGEQWLKDNPKEAVKLESVGGQQHKEVVEKALEQNNFISRLPYIGPGFLFKIDYGGPEPGNKFPDQPTIFIQGETEENQQSAIEWMRNRGYDPDKMNIVFQLKSPE